MPQGLRARDLRQERVHAGVTQKALADALGMHRTVLSLIENEHAPISDEFIDQYRSALQGLAEAVA